MSDARDALLWVMEMAHDNHPDSHGRIADDFLAKHEVVLRSDLSDGTFRATVTDAGGGYVTLLVERDTMNYPRIGSTVVVAYEKKTPEDWARLKGIVIVDPDGWRDDENYRRWDEPITEEEFRRRAAVSTIANRKEDGSW